jgi:hypothetical protein
MRNADGSTQTRSAGGPTYKIRRRCAECGQPLPPLRRSGSGGRNRRYCSDRCRQAAYRRRKKAQEDAGR